MVEYRGIPLGISHIPGICNGNVFFIWGTIISILVKEILAPTAFSRKWWLYLYLSMVCCDRLVWMCILPGVDPVIINSINKPPSQANYTRVRDNRNK